MSGWFTLKEGFDLLKRYPTLQDELTYGIAECLRCKGLGWEVPPVFREALGMPHTLSFPREVKVPCKQCGGGRRLLVIYELTETNDPVGEVAKRTIERKNRRRIEQLETLMEKSPPFEAWICKEILKGETQ